MNHIEVIRYEMIRNLKYDGWITTEAYVSELTKIIHMTNDEIFKFRKDQIS